MPLRKDALPHAPNAAKKAFDYSVNQTHLPAMPRQSDVEERLMNAAMDLIWENSYGATSVDAICAQADARKGSFYHFFKSKSELAVKALEADWQQKKARMDEIFSASVAPLDRLRCYFEHVYEGQTKAHGECGSVLGCPYCSLGCEIGTQDRAIGEQVRKILDRNAKYFESAIRDAHAQGLIAAPDAKAKAQMLIAFFQGSLAQARIENDVRPLRRLAPGALELLGAKKTTRAK
jgi:TetR/AcrR family transcriptional regulator, transcriptional repressor for nem operon